MPIIAPRASTSGPPEFSRIDMPRRVGLNKFAGRAHGRLPDSDDSAHSTQFRE